MKIFFTRAVASNRQTEALASVIVFRFQLFIVIKSIVGIRRDFKHGHMSNLICNNNCLFRYFRFVLIFTLLIFVKLPFILVFTK